MIIKIFIWSSAIIAKAQISPLIRAVWLGHSLSVNRIIRRCRMYQWRANARMRLRMRGMNLNLDILRMFEDIFSLDVADFML